MSQARQREILRAPALSSNRLVLLSLLGVAPALPGDLDPSLVLLSLPLAAPALPGDRPVLLGLPRLEYFVLLPLMACWASPSA